MKNFILIFVFLNVAFNSYSQVSVLTPEETTTYCNVLQKLSNEAIDSNNIERLIHYYTAYKAFQEYYNPTDGCSRYFREIKTLYKNELKDWIVGVRIPEESLPPLQRYTPTITTFMHSLSMTTDSLGNATQTLATTAAVRPIGTPKDFNKDSINWKKPIAYKIKNDAFGNRLPNATEKPKYQE